MSEPSWKALVDELKSSKFILRIGKLASLFETLADGYLLTSKDKQFILESHKS